MSSDAFRDTETGFIFSTHEKGGLFAGSVGVSRHSHPYASLPLLDKSRGSFHSGGNCEPPEQFEGEKIWWFDTIFYETLETALDKRRELATALKRVNIEN